MRTIVSIVVILILVSWVATSIEFPADASGAAIVPLHETQWRRTTLGWMPRESWTQEPAFTGAAIDPLTLALFESLLATFAIIALTQSRTNAG